MCSVLRNLIIKLPTLTIPIRTKFIQRSKFSSTVVAANQNIKFSNPKDDILSAEEKRQKIILRISLATFDHRDPGGYEYGSHPVNDFTVDESDRTLKLQYTHEEYGSKRERCVSMEQRIIQEKDAIVIFSSVLCKIKRRFDIVFANETIAEKMIKIIWKYKIGAASVDEITSIPPPPTITHSNHDIASVFSFEERYAPVKLSTSENTTSQCSLFIDVENQVIIVQPKNSDFFELKFSHPSQIDSKIIVHKFLDSNFECESRSKLIFKLDNNRNIEFEFSDDSDIAKKVKNILEESLYLTMDQEKTALEWNLKKFSDDPKSIQEFKKIIQAYVKRFIIFKEENHQIIFDMYEKYNFHEMIFGAQAMAELGVQEGESYTTSRKREASKIVDDEIVAKKTKRSDDADGMLHVRYPNFEFQCDENGAPKQKLIIFSSSDKKMCHVFENTEDEFQCPRCNKTAEYVINQYGERYIKIPSRHSCEPIPYEAQVDHEIVGFIPQKRKEDRWLKSWEPLFLIFTPSKKAFYRFVESDVNSTIIHCLDCCRALEDDHYVYATVTGEEGGRRSIQILDEDHVCKPEEYRMPKKIVD